MKRTGIKMRSRTKSQIAGKKRKPPAKRVQAENVKADFIGRLKGVIRIVGDIESPVVPPEAWEYD